MLEYCSKFDSKNCENAKILDRDPDFEVPSRAGENPNICEYSNKCDAQYLLWKKNYDLKEKENISGDIKENKEINEALNEAEKAAKLAEEAAAKAAALAAQNKGDPISIKEAENAAKAAEEAKIRADQLRKGTGNIGISRVNFGVPEETIKKIGGSLGNSLSEGNTRRAALDAYILSKELEYNERSNYLHEDASQLREKKMAELMKEIDGLNSELQSLAKEHLNPNKVNTDRISKLNELNELKNKQNSLEVNAGEGSINTENFIGEGYLNYSPF